MEMRFTVWQFVRLMVHLEETPKPTPAEAALLADWRDVWTPLDEELARLAETDADAYGAMMMDQDVVFEDVVPERAETAKAVLETVMADMDAAIDAADAHGEADDGLLQSLKFERRELRQLTRKLARQLGSG